MGRRHRVRDRHQQPDRRSNGWVTGQVIGIDMTPAMLDKASESAAGAGHENVEFPQSYGESLPVSDGWADVVISNGLLNLIPDKRAAMNEMARAHAGRPIADR